MAVNVMGRRSIMLAGLMALGGCATGEAVAQNGVVDLQVLDRDGGRLLQKHEKDGRSFVAGEEGRRYALKVSNRSAGRVLVVLTVDGVNVVSGQTGGWNQVGYVLDPWQSYEINGWRKSDRQIAAFEFTGLRNSYAARTGRPMNVGVIGMAEFAEKPRPPVAWVAPQAPIAERSARAESNGASAMEGTGARSSNSSAADASRPAEAPQKLGTGHGEREWAATRRVEFERASREPYAVTTIEYDSFDALVAAGVIAPARPQPRAFPGSPEYGFVADPPRR